MKFIKKMLIEPFGLVLLFSVLFLAINVMFQKFLADNKVVNYIYDSSHISHLAAVALLWEL